MSTREPENKATRLIRAILLLPVMVTLVIPAAILYWTDSAHLDWPVASPVDLMPLATGIILVVLGSILAFRTASLFFRWGEGTPAPWDPPRRLVVRGVYRHVRNPMISAVIAILIGEVLLAGSLPLLGWALLFTAANLIYIPRIEEPGLERRFGRPYARYRENVPRWIPRLRPWDGAPEDGGAETGGGAPEAGDEGPNSLTGDPPDMYA